MNLIRAPNLGVPHGFTTRAGGVSAGPYASLNLGLSSGDAEGLVAKNRRRVLQAFGTPPVCAFHQVHGDRVLAGRASWFEEQADAVVSDVPGLLLIVSTADCLPVLFHDPRTGAVGAAHCGWRGTLKGLAAKTLREMVKCCGSRPQDVRVAFGPAIAAPCYEVGPEVAAAFAAAGFPGAVCTGAEGRHLDVAAANRWLLLGAGVLPENLWESGLCTCCERERFYSHRRDRGVTGRHWALIQAR